MSILHGTLSLNLQLMTIMHQINNSHCLLPNLSALIRAILDMIKSLQAAKGALPSHLQFSQIHQAGIF